MQLRKVGSAFLVAFLISTAAPLMVNLLVISVSMQVLAETQGISEQRDMQNDRYRRESIYHRRHNRYTDRRERNNSRNISGLVYYKLGDYIKAINYHKQGLEIARSTGDRVGEINSLNGLGLAYRSLGEYEKAISYHKQGLKIARSIGDRAGESASLGNLGLIYESLGEYEKAISYHKQGLKIVRSIGDRKREGKFLNNLGIVYDSQGNYKIGINYHKQGLEIARYIGDRAGESSSLGNLGLVYNKLGYYTKAINYHQQDLEIARSIGDRAGKSASLGNLGLAYFYLGDYAKAVNYHKQGLEIARSIGDRAGESSSLGNLGLAYKKLREYTKAIDYHQQSLEIARKLGNLREEGNSLGNLGSIYRLQRKYTKAIDYHQQSLEIARKLGNLKEEGDSLNNLGLAYLYSQQPKQAEKYLRDAIQVHESLRSLLGDNHTLKVSFFDTQAVTYRFLQQTLVAQKQNYKALEIAERGRGRAFAELIIEKQQLSSSPPPNIQQIRLVAKQQNATIVYYSIAWDDLYIWVVKPSGIIVFHKADLKDKNLGNFAQDTLNTTVQIAGVHSPKLSLANDLIPEWVAKTRSAVSKTDDNPSPSSSPDQVRRLSCRGNICLQQMYNLLIQPIAKELPINPQDRVIFVPHKSLFLVPFAALQNEKDKKFLIENHTISIAPSIQVLQLTYAKKQALKSQPSTANNSMLVVGNPTMPEVADTIGAEPEQLDPLPGAEQEAIEIAKMFKTQPLTGKQATKAVVTKQMAQAKYIHLATHGFLDNLDEPGIPGTIALAPEGKDNGLLSADEVLKMKLKADLVVLSACETGRGKITGDGVIGLPRAFISAGTPSVVVSLWQVSDESTAFFMPEFYRQLKIHNNKATALRQAMLKTMKKYPDARDWSAFLLIGEAD